MDQTVTPGGGNETETDKTNQQQAPATPDRGKKKTVSPSKKRKTAPQITRITRSQSPKKKTAPPITRSQSPKKKKPETDQTHQQLEPDTTPARRNDKVSNSLSFLLSSSSNKKHAKDTSSSSSKTTPRQTRSGGSANAAPPLPVEQSGSLKLKANQPPGPCGIFGCNNALLAPTHFCKMCHKVVHSLCAINFDLTGGGKGDSRIYYCSRSCKEKKEKKNRSTRVKPSNKPGPCSIDPCKYPTQSPSHVCKICRGGVHNLCAQEFKPGPLKGGGEMDGNIFYCSPACMEEGESHAAP